MRHNMNRSQLYLVAANSLIDTRTIGRYDRGERIRPVSRERIETALRALGLTSLIRTSTAAEVA